MLYATHATHAMYAHKKRRKAQRTQRIESMRALFFACMRHVFRFLIASQAVRRRASSALRVLCTTTGKPHVGLWKQILKVGFQAAVRNATEATHVWQACVASVALLVMRRRSKKPQRTQCTHTKNATGKDRIGCMLCVFSRACIAYFSSFIASQAVCHHVAYYCLQTPCRPMWHKAVDISLMSQWISSHCQTQHSNEQNYVLSNYLTFWRQWPVCQFSWCPQRDMNPLWPVIKLQGDSTSDH